MYPNNKLRIYGGKNKAIYFFIALTYFLLLSLRIISLHGSHNPINPALAGSSTILNGHGPLTKNWKMVCQTSSGSSGTSSSPSSRTPWLRFAATAHAIWYAWNWVSASRCSAIPRHSLCFKHLCVIGIGNGSHTIERHSFCPGPPLTDSLMYIACKYLGRSGICGVVRGTYSTHVSTSLNRLDFKFSRNMSVSGWLATHKQ